MKTLKLKIQNYEVYLLLIIPLIILSVLHILGFNGLYGQDAYEYLRYTDAIQQYLSGGAHPDSFYWPVLYPTLGALLGYIFNSTTLALQIISCISISVTWIFVFKMLNFLYPKAKQKFNYVLLFGLFSPFILKMGLIVMSDALALAFVTLTFYYFLKFYTKNTNLIFVFFFATCALMSRYASVFITLPVIIFSLYLTLKRKEFKAFTLSVLLSFTVTIPFIVFQWDALFEATNNYFLKVWSITNYFKTDYVTQDGTQSHLLPNLLYTLEVFFHPGFIFSGLILSIISIRFSQNLKHNFNKVLLISIALYVFFLAGIPFQNQRILGLVFPLVLVLFFSAFQKLISFKFVQHYFIFLLISSFILQLAFFTYTFRSIFKRNILENEISDMIKPYQNKTLYSFDLDLALKGKQLNFDFKNMFVKFYKTYKKGDLILFNPKRYQKQWHDKIPMKNWNYMKTNYILDVLETHPKGWKLYQIK